MKNRMLAIAVLLAVLVVITGVVAASSQSASPNPLEIQPGGSGVVTITYTGYGTDNIVWSLLDPLGNPTTQIVADSGSGNAQNGIYAMRDGIGHVIRVTDLSTSNSYEYYKLRSCLQSQCEDQIVTVRIKYIPEFPTVALPIGAVIGLVFLFQQKRRKQE